MQRFHLFVVVAEAYLKHLNDYFYIHVSANDWAGWSASLFTSCFEWDRNAQHQKMCTRGDRERWLQYLNKYDVILI